MGRTGITEVAVRQAITEIVATGQEPSVRKIQVLIGGSSTTVASLLRKIQDEDGGMFGPGQIVDKELNQLVTSLHDRLNAITEQKIAVGKLEAQNLVGEAEARLAREKHEHAETVISHSALKLELEASKAANERLVELLNAANSQIAVDAKTMSILQENAESQKTEIARLQREGELRQVAFEAFQAATQRAREATQETNARERQSLIDSHSVALADMRLERDKLTQERAELTATNGQLARDNERLAHEVITYGKNLRGAQDAQRDLQAKLDQAGREASEARIAAAVSESHVTDLRSQILVINANKETAVAELQSTRSKVENLTSEVARQQAEIESLRNPETKS